MSKRTDQNDLGDIQEAMQKILAYITGLTYDQFIQDIKTQDAVVRNLEIIGEATKNLSGKLRKAHPKIPWKEMAGMRDKMIHDYFGINYEIVWTVATEELSTLLPKIAELLTKENNDE